MANSAGGEKGEKPQLILRGNVWYANNVSVRVGKHCQRIRGTSGFKKPDKAKAEAWLRRRISEVENELLYGPAPETPTKPATAGFGTAALDYAKRGGKRGPLGDADIAKLETLSAFFGQRPCDELDQHDWNDFVHEELEGRSGETIRRWFAMFRAPIRRELQQHGLAFREFDLPPPGAGRTIFLEEDVADELHACYAPHAHPIVTMLRYQGCRVSEALGLRLPGDISFPRGTITFRDTKNGDSRRIVPMHERTAAALEAHLTTENGRRRELGPVFPTPDGEAYNDRRLASRGIGGDGSGIRTAHRGALTRWALARVIGRDGPDCRRCGKPAEYPQLQLIRSRPKGGVDELHNYRMICAACARAEPRAADQWDPRHTWFHIHDWRHHWASWFMMKGGRETELMRLGGWKDARMIQRYVALSVEHLRKAVNQV
jgi:integrase